MNTAALSQILNEIRLPESNRTLLSLKAQYFYQDVSGSPSLEIKLPIPVNYWEKALRDDVLKALNAHNLSHLDLTISSNIIAHKVGNRVETLGGVKNIIAIASGKGGVGKSTVSANLAMALHKMGARVGLLDADLYGPSQPTMFGAIDEKPVQKNGQFIPIQRFGIQLMSIGFMVDASQAVIWRGPLITQALKQMIFQSAWDNLDYLLIDLPPGTGDIQLTLSQKIPVTAAVIVSTPQDIALIDAQKAIDMFKKVNIATLGIVENMSVHICSECGHREALFGENGGEKLAKAYHLPLLAQLPLSLAIRQAMDLGKLDAIHDNQELSQAYRQAACNIVFSIADMAKDYSHTFPKVVVE